MPRVPYGRDVVGGPMTTPDAVTVALSAQRAQIARQLDDEARRQADAGNHGFAAGMLLAAALVRDGRVVRVER